MSYIGNPRKGFSVMAYNKQKRDREARSASPSHRHGSPRTERGETTGPKPSKTTGPTTYTMTYDFCLKDPSDYQWVTETIRHQLEDLPRFVQMQTDGPFFKKKEEVKDG